MSEHKNLKMSAFIIYGGGRASHIDQEYRNRFPARFLQRPSFHKTNARVQRECVLRKQINKCVNAIQKHSHEQLCLFY